MVERSLMKISTKHFLIQRIINGLTRIYYFYIKNYKNISEKRRCDDFSFDEKRFREKLPENIWPEEYKAVFNFQLDDFSVKSNSNAAATTGN